MQETPLPAPDAGFVVDWQLTDDGGVLDLTTAESEVVLPDEATIRASLGIGPFP